MDDDRRYRSRSLWLDTVPGTLTPRPAFTGSTQLDVAIVGAGFTGLWTALYLRLADPTLRIAVFEAEVAGFGASGRNGGWASALLPMSFDTIASSSTRADALAMFRLMQDAVDEVGAQSAAQGIDCHFRKGGTTVLARTPTQVARLRTGVADDHARGFTNDDIQWLEPDEAMRRVNATSTLGATFTPHCARIHPARLARGLADAVERLGVPIYEHSPVLSIDDREIRLPGGTARSDIVVRAAEGYTTSIKAHHRALAPIYSLMLATEPLPTEFWDEVGWSDHDTLADGRHMIIYAQRTADDRIAFGGRGAPYHFGSAIHDRFDTNADTHAELHRSLRELFPQLGDATITHRWGGPLAVPRDWWASVGFDRNSGFAWAGGYLGDGVTTTNLAARTLVDLILGRVTDLTRLPWVGHRSRAWEPEPFRWIGINAAATITRSMDSYEDRTGRESSWRQRAFRLFGNDH
jgi:glycine/D-amino acid oxidase-like deaminating enzyme